MKSQQGRPWGNCRTRCHLVLDLFVIIMCIMALVSVNYLVKPTHQGFFCDDNSIKYPYQSSTVRNDVIVVVTIIGPVAMMFLVEVFSRCLGSRSPDGNPRTQHREPLRLWAVVRAFMSYFWGYLALNMMLVVLKTSSGQLRPHFLAVCKPDVNFDTCRGYVDEYNCTNTDTSDKILNAARQSFPSGHAANAVYMALFLILYMEVRLKTCHCQLLKLTSYAALMSYALWCSATRVSDHMHHMRDVVVGGVLGLVVAIVTFFRGAMPCMRKDLPICRDIESSCSISDNSNNSSNNGKKTNTINTVTSSYNGGHDDDEDHDDDDSLKNVESDTPTTPTPLLSYKATVTPSPGLKINSLMLEGNKHNFVRKCQSSVY